MDIGWLESRRVDLLLLMSSKATKGLVLPQNVFFPLLPPSQVKCAAIACSHQVSLLI